MRFEHFVAAAEEAERGWAKQYAVTLYKEALDMTPDGRRRAGPLPAQAARRRAAGALPPGGDVRVLGLGGEPRLDGREVRGRHVAGDLVQQSDLVPAEPASSARGRSPRSAPRRRSTSCTSPSSSTTTWLCSHVISGNSLLGELARTAADGRHLRPRRPRSCGRSGSAAWRAMLQPCVLRGEGHGASLCRSACRRASSRRASGAPTACTAPCGTGSRGSRCARSRCGSGCGSGRRATR